jgi:lipid II:glycine glycyltransferase (peptidoglycan interpeptide bridge formation enzyme)
MIKYSKSAGIEEFDFGGYATGQIGEDLAGINHFKDSFRGTLVDKYSYSKSYSRSHRAITSIQSTAATAGQKIKSLTAENNHGI